jgi:hypothetical protein
MWRNLMDGCCQYHWTRRHTSDEQSLSVVSIFFIYQQYGRGCVFHCYVTAGFQHFVMLMPVSFCGWNCGDHVDIKEKMP